MSMVVVHTLAWRHTLVFFFCFLGRETCWRMHAFMPSADVTVIQIWQQFAAYSSYTSNITSLRLQLAATLRCQINKNEDDDFTILNLTINRNYYFIVPQILLFYFNYYFILFYCEFHFILFLSTLTFIWNIDFYLEHWLYLTFEFQILKYFISTSHFCVKRTDMLALDALYKNKTLSLSLNIVVMCCCIVSMALFWSLVS